VTANLRRYQKTDTRRLYLKWLESCDLATPSFLREKTVEIEKSYRAPDGRRMQNALFENTIRIGEGRNIEVGAWLS